MGAIDFTQTLHDSNTFPEVLEQYAPFNGKQPDKVYAVRGYKKFKEY